MSLLLVSCGSSPKEVAPARFIHDAYVWQRLWNGEIAAALQQALPYVHAWRVLGGEAGSRSLLVPTGVNFLALRQTGKPIVLVVRIDGRDGGRMLSPALLSSIVALLQRWQTSGVLLQGLEIDFDCSVLALPRYSAFLKQLHDRVGSGFPLSITALPSWIGNPALSDVLAAADESVLQVHSVNDAKQGLFNADKASHWSQVWSTETKKPFRVALPTYWSKVTWDQTGRVSAIESEMPRHGRQQDGMELIVRPRDVQAAVNKLRELRLEHLVGLAWFRLPTKLDRRAWSFATWRAVLLQESLTQATRVAVRLQGDGSGTRNAYVMNVGEVDSELPQRITVAAQGCSYADAFFPYDTQRTADGLQWTRKENDLLKAGTERLVGWARCSGKDWQSHVDF